MSGVPGNRGGAKGRSGRKPNQATLLKRALSIIDANFEEIVQQCVENAIKGDKESIFYCIDRKLGRPAISIDQRVRGVVRITADERRIAIMEAHEDMRRVLELPVGSQIIEEEGSQIATK